MKLQKLGGIAGIVLICTYILYRVLLQNIFAHIDDSNDPAKMITALATASSQFYVLNIVNIISFIMGIIFIYVLYDRLKDNAPHLSRIMLIMVFVGSAFPIAWSMINIKELSMIVPAKNVSAYLAVQVASSGINSLGDHAWGWVYLLMGCAVLKTKSFSAIPGWLAILTGIMWIPLFAVIPILFSWIGFLSQGPYIASTIWLGVELLRQK